MQLHDLKPRVKNKKAKRIGRGSGSGHGKTSTRGHKGAKARAGRLFYIGFEGDNVPFFRKIPKRGFNHRKRINYQIVNVGQIGALFAKDAKVTPQELFSRNLVKQQDSPVKVLGKGILKKPLNFAAHKFSKLAKDKIEKAGGKIEYISR
ncbi:MAG: 50S ribosomal protein L15 [Candidatus Omnitrophica bacterium]|nr:50S ribosomal protein L15 [Candidatus Omnitrophota bacterium]